MQLQQKGRSLMYRPSLHLLPAITTAGVAILSPTAVHISAGPQVSSAATTVKPVGARACADADRVYLPLTWYIRTGSTRRDYEKQFTRLELAIHCLVNEARAGKGKQAYTRPLAISANRLGLGGAASDHAKAAVKQRWWGTVAQVPGCRPYPQDRTRCDSHYNPVTGKYPADRAALYNYTRGCTRFRVGENTYTWSGRDGVTPQKAFNFWMNSTQGHAEAILSDEYREMRVAVVPGSADPGAPNTYPALTYVQVFGFCNR
ncbi:CAP domain-containing protein [Nonomuraea sp. NPDC002799]